MVERGEKGSLESDHRRSCFPHRIAVVGGGGGTRRQGCKAGWFHLSLFARSLADGKRVLGKATRKVHATLLACARGGGKVRYRVDAGARPIRLARSPNRRQQQMGRKGGGGGRGGFRSERACTGPVPKTPSGNTIFSTLAARFKRGEEGREGVGPMLRRGTGVPCLMHIKGGGEGKTANDG